MLYVAIGAIAYGLIYYFFFYKKGGYSYNDQETSYNNQVNSNVQNPNDENLQTQDYFEIKEVGLKFKITNDLKDLTYSVRKWDDANTVSFSTHSLESSGESDCKANEGPIGTISIFKNYEEATGGFTYLIESESFYVTYAGSQAACSDKEDVSSLQANLRDSLANALKTIVKFTK